MKKESQYFQRNYRYWLPILLSAISIIFGGIIYILFRPIEPVFFRLFNLIGLEGWTSLVRRYTIPESGNLPEWLVYTLPNGLWAFAYTVLIFSIWGGSKSRLKYVWFVSIPILVFGFESLQLTGFIRGTFSFQDIFSGLIGIIVGIITVITTTKLYSYEKNKN